MKLPVRATDNLRIGRWSVAGARYFVTLCTQDREPKLLADLPCIRRGLERSQQDGDIQLHAAGVMPDHLHLLFTLGERIEYGQAIGKFKSLTQRTSAVGALSWQRDSFEHRLRADEDAESYGFYIFMNPYRAGICPLDQRWSGWICPDPRFLNFLASLGPSAPVPTEWIHRGEKIEDEIRKRFGIS